MSLITFFPVYGLLFGISYADTSMDEDFKNYDDDDFRMIQIALGLFGISIIW